jgi:purine catabolism regulator
MLTIREALELPALESAKLVAGGGGLDNAVRWVHIVDLPNPNFEWVQGGELLLTSGYGLFNDERNPIPRLASKGLSGIVLSLGQKFERTPARLREAADEHDLPIIETPPELAFIEVTEAILNQILDRQSSLQQHGDEIQRSLMKQVLEGETLQGLAEALSEKLDRSITIENEDFEVLAAAEAGLVDEARARSIREGRATPEVTRELIQGGVYARLLNERRPLRVAPLPELGMTMERIVAPIFVGNRIVGYVWIIAGERALTELDEIAIEHAATIVAVILLKEGEVRRAALERRDDLLEQLLGSTGSLKRGLREQVHKLGFRAQLPYQVLLIKGANDTKERLREMSRTAERWLAEVSGPALVSEHGDRVVVVLQSHAPDLTEPLAERLMAELSRPGFPIKVGVGGPVDELLGLRTSHDQAAEALELAGALGRKEGIVTFAELGSLRWLQHLPEETLQGNSYFRAAVKLAEHDAAHKSAWLESLEAYLLSGGKTMEAARKLSVHRNSLAYRLRRIEELLDVDLSQAHTRFELHIALMAYRLRNTGR